MGSIRFTEEIVKDAKRLKEQLNLALQEQTSLGGAFTQLKQTVTTVQQVITQVQEIITDAAVSILNDVATVVGVRSKLQFNNSAPITWTIADDALNQKVTLTPTLTNTGVTPSIYGDGTHVGQFQVDAQGRITNAANVVITAGAAGVKKESHVILAIDETEVTF